MVELLSFKPKVNGNPWSFSKTGQKAMLVVSIEEAYSLPVAGSSHAVPVSEELRKSEYTTFIATTTSITASALCFK